MISNVARAGALLPFAYLCGSIPTGVWLSRARGVDPRDLGSGNIGATNVARTAGADLGALTLAGDASKGLVPVLVATWMGANERLVVATALAAFCGHLFSCFLRFRGGKGVATALGVLLGLAPAVALLLVLVFALILAATRYVSVASLVAAGVSPLALLLFGYGHATVAGAVVMAALIALRHRDNIRRLRFGTEARLGTRRSISVDSGIA